MEKQTNEEKTLNSVLKKQNKKESKYILKSKMKKRVKNSQTISNIKSIDDDGLINLKTGEVCSLIEVKAIDLSLTSNSEKNNFFYTLKSLYQIKGLNLKCYKIDEKLNLNKLTEIYSSNLESTDLSTVVLETGFISDENMGDSIYKDSGLKLKGEMTEKISKMIKNHSLDGCFINGVEILSEEDKKVQEEKRKQVIHDYEEYKSQLESQIDETIKRVQ